MTPRPIILILVQLLAASAIVACSREPMLHEDLSSLAEAVSAAGVPCDRIDPGPGAQLVGETGTCFGSGVRIYLFDRAEDIDDWKKVGTQVGPIVLGPNWAAIGDPDHLGRISDELGGELVREND